MSFTWTHTDRPVYAHLCGQTIVEAMRAINNLEARASVEETQFKGYKQTKFVIGPGETQVTFDCPPIANLVGDAIGTKEDTSLVILESLSSSATLPALSAEVVSSPTLLSEYQVTYNSGILTVRASEEGTRTITFRHAKFIGVPNGIYFEDPAIFINDPLGNPLLESIDGTRLDEQYINDLRTSLENTLIHYKSPDTDDPWSLETLYMYTHLNKSISEPNWATDPSSIQDPASNKPWFYTDLTPSEGTVNFDVITIEEILKMLDVLEGSELVADELREDFEHYHLISEDTNFHRFEGDLSIHPDYIWSYLAGVTASRRRYFQHLTSASKIGIHADTRSEHKTYHRVTSSVYYGVRIEDTEENNYVNLVELLPSGEDWRFKFSTNSRLYIGATPTLPFPEFSWEAFQDWGTPEAAVPGDWDRWAFAGIKFFIRGDQSGHENVYWIGSILSEGAEAPPHNIFVPDYPYIHPDYPFYPCIATSSSFNTDISPVDLHNATTGQSDTTVTIRFPSSAIWVGQAYHFSIVLPPRSIYTLDWTIELPECNLSIDSIVMKNLVEHVAV